MFVIVLMCLFSCYVVSIALFLSLINYQSHIRHYIVLLKKCQLCFLIKTRKFLPHFYEIINKWIGTCLYQVDENPPDKLQSSFLLWAGSESGLRISFDTILTEPATGSFFQMHGNKKTPGTRDCIMHFLFLSRRFSVLTFFYPVIYCFYFNTICISVLFYHR